MIREVTERAFIAIAVSGEEVKARSERILDREIVTPRLKFLWETYRSVLDCIRMIPKLEGLYKVRKFEN